MHTEYTADRIKKYLYKISLILSVSALICVCQPGGNCSKVYAADEETSNEEISDEMSDDDKKAFLLNAIRRHIEVQP